MNDEVEEFDVPWYGEIKDGVDHGVDFIEREIKTYRTEYDSHYIWRDWDVNS